MSWEKEGRQEDVKLVAGVELTLLVVSCWCPLNQYKYISGDFKA